MFDIKRKATLGLTLLTVSGATFLGAIPVSMAGAPGLSVSASSVQAGGSVDVSGACAGDAVVVGLYSGTITGDSAPDDNSVTDDRIVLDGTNWNWTLNVPADTPAGNYTVNAECQGDGSSFLNVPLRVEAAEVTSTSTTMAPTSTTVPATSTTMAPKLSVAPATAVSATPTYTG